MWFCLTAFLIWFAFTWPGQGPDMTWDWPSFFQIKNLVQDLTNKVPQSRRSYSPHRYFQVTDHWNCLLFYSPNLPLSTCLTHFMRFSSFPNASLFFAGSGCLRIAHPDRKMKRTPLIYYWRAEVPSQISWHLKTFWRSIIINPIFHSWKLWIKNLPQVRHSHLWVYLCVFKLALH